MRYRRTQVVKRCQGRDRWSAAATTTRGPFACVDAPSAGNRDAMNLPEGAHPGSGRRNAVLQLFEPVLYKNELGERLRLVLDHQESAVARDVVCRIER